MKRRATAILLGIMVSSMFLSACGKNEAKEEANENLKEMNNLLEAKNDTSIKTAKMLRNKLNNTIKN